MYVCGMLHVIQADESFMQSLFKGLNDDDNDDDDEDIECRDTDDDDAGDDAKLRRRRDVAQFLKEFCLFSQTLAPQNRDGFFKVLANVYSSLILTDQSQICILYYWSIKDHVYLCLL